MVGAYLLRRALNRCPFAVVFASLVVGCSSDLVVPVPSSNDPLLYLVLGDPAITPSGQPDTVLYALLATTGTPIESPPRSAIRFEIREAGSGAIYDWRPKQPVHSLGFGDEELGRISEVANYFLPWSSSAAGRGASDQIYGATYTLDIDTEGVHIHGSTTLPERFAITIETVGDERRIIWPRVKGAAGYLVLVRQPAEPGQFFGLRTFGGTTVDTTVAVPTQFMSGDSVIVEARDANYITAIQDQNAGTRRGRVGIDAGYGVFAAVTRAKTVLP
jgi:hypothetical protein